MSEVTLSSPTRIKFSGAQLRAYRADSWIGRARQIECGPTQTERERRGALDDRFTAYWIALNALYGQARYRGTEGTERSHLRTFLEFVQRTPVADQVRATMRAPDARAPVQKLLGDAFLDNDNWAHWDAEGIMDEALRVTSRTTAKDRESDVIELFFRLYVLRTQLFHGCAARGSSSKGKTMEYAVRLLDKLLPLFVAAVREHGGKQRFFASPPYPPSEPREPSAAGAKPFNQIRASQAKR
jgi:hypothetical protein